MSIRSPRPPLSPLSAGLFLLLLTQPTLPAAADDWPGWRGPHRDGVSRETGLLERWPEGGPPLVWKADGLGKGYSSVAVVGEILVTQGTRGRQEQVIALDVGTGEERWAQPHGPMYTNGRGDGPRGTPVIDGGRVYVLGGNGNLSSFDLETGRRAWSINVLREFGARNISWGLSESPLVVDDLLLLNPGGRGASIVALDKGSGEVVWKRLSDRAGYSSAVLAEVGEKRQAIFFTHDRALGIEPSSGRVLWEYERVANRTANAATPIYRDGRVFLSSDYGTGGALLDLRGDGARPVYFSREMRNHHSSSVLVGEHLYGFSSSILTAMEFLTGEVAWKARSVGKGSLIAADGHLYLLSERGRVALAEATPAGYREKGRFALPRVSSQATWAHPALAERRLYLRDQQVLYSYDVRSKD